MKLILFSTLILPFASARNLEYKILHGTRSAPKNWMVALRYNLGGGCGGVLYTRSMVISAAHCAKLDTKDWLAYLNRVDLSKGSEEEGSVHKVLRYAIHPKYTGTLHFDVSAWWIENNSDERTLVDLDDGSELKDKIDLLSIAGWGRMKERGPGVLVGNDPSSNVLLEAQVPLNDDSKCIARYGQKFYAETMLCTGYDESGPSTCQGDSGGPVYRARGDRIILIGIISHGDGCGYQDYYSKETKVSSPRVTNFIKKYAELFTLDNLDNVVLDFSERYRDLSNSSNATNIPVVLNPSSGSENVVENPTALSANIKPEDKTIERIIPVIIEGGQHRPDDSVNHEKRPNSLKDSDRSSTDAATSDKHTPIDIKGKQPNIVSHKLGTDGRKFHKGSSSQLPVNIHYTEDRPQKPARNNDDMSIKYYYQNPRDPVSRASTIVDYPVFSSYYPDSNRLHSTVIQPVFPANFDYHRDASYQPDSFRNDQLHSGYSPFSRFSQPIGSLFPPSTYSHFPHHSYSPSHLFDNHFLL